MKDNINPDHYKKGGVECIIALEAATVGKTGIEAVCTANVIKYLWRYEDKNGLEDVRKGMWYLQRLISVLEAKETRKYPLTPEESYKELKEEEIHRGDLYRSNNLLDKDVYELIFNESKQVVILRTKEDKVIHTVPSEDFLNNFTKIELFDKVSIRNSKEEKKVSEEDDKLIPVPFEKVLYRDKRTKKIFDLIARDGWDVILRKQNSFEPPDTIEYEEFITHYELVEEEKKVSEIPSKSLKGQKFIHNQAQEIFKSLIGKKIIQLANDEVFTIDRYNEHGVFSLKSNKGIAVRTYFELMDETLWKQVDS